MDDAGINPLDLLRAHDVIDVKEVHTYEGEIDGLGAVKFRILDAGAHETHGRWTVEVYDSVHSQVARAEGDRLALALGDVFHHLNARLGGGHRTCRQVAGINGPRPAGLSVRPTGHRDRLACHHRQGRGDPVDARRILLVIGLSVGRVDQVILSADGTGADEALAQLVELLEIDHDAH